MDWCDSKNPKLERYILVKALRKKRNEFVFLFRLAEVYENLLNFQKAIYYGKKALRLTPNNTTYLEFMAFVCTKEGKTDLAQKYWEMLVHIDPDDSYYWTEWEVLRDTSIN